MTTRRLESIDTLELTQKELAGLFGVTSRTIFNLRADGMPSTPHGGKVLYPAAACVQWYIARVRAEAKARAGESRREAREREDIARADRTEAEAALAKMKLERERGELVTIEEYRTTLERHLVALRDVLTAMPHRYAGRWPGDLSENVETLKAILRDLFADLRDTGRRLMDAGAGAADASETAGDTDATRTTTGAAS